jgi:hypothetical protein
MSRLAWLWLLCSLVACSSTLPRVHQHAVYGDPTVDGVAVTVGKGFQYPGTYYLPKGAKLGLLLDVARVLPAVKDWRDGLGAPVPCQVRWANKLYKAVAELGEEMRSKTFRELELYDGDDVAFIVVNF